MFAEPILTLVAGVFGALLGSFLNVCVHRLPRGESVVRPRSRCPACGAPIAWYDNIPVVSWLVLRGRCRRCHAGIAVHYPLVEAAVAATWAGAVWWWGATGDALHGAVLLTLLLGIAITDARDFLIPDEFTLGGLGAGLALAFAADRVQPVDAVIGAATGFGVMWVVKAAGDLAVRRGLIRGEEVQDTLGADEPASAMGWGDVKMMAMLGAFLGWRGVLATVFLGALAGTLFFLPHMVRGRRPLVPFGVFLAVGAAIALVWGEGLGRWYASLVGS